MTKEKKYGFHWGKKKKDSEQPLFGVEIDDNYIELITENCVKMGIDVFKVGATIGKCKLLLEKSHSDANDIDELVRAIFVCVLLYGKQHPDKVTIYEGTLKDYMKKQGPNSLYG